MVKGAALLPKNIDAWFGPVMDRVSQRFAVHTRLWTVVFSFMLVFAFHVDTFSIMAQLSSDAELRARVASGADALMSRAELGQRPRSRPRPIPPGGSCSAAPIASGRC